MLDSILWFKVESKMYTSNSRLTTKKTTLRKNGKKHYNTKHCIFEGGGGLVGATKPASSLTYFHVIKLLLLMY